jgi:NAD(P)-dependent dehydrogenase (short-subunit alcohol dehydrogenase family)
MGREEALLFAKEGAKVIATDINEAAVQAVVKEIEAAKSRLLVVFFSRKRGKLRKIKMNQVRGAFNETNNHGT